MWKEAVDVWRKAAVVAVVAALVVGTLGMSLAYADNNSTTPATSLRDLFLQKLAGQLGVDQNTLLNDITQAAKSAVQAAEEQGLISSERAAALNQAIDNGGPWAVLGLRNRRAAPGVGIGPFLGPAAIKTVATYLGMTEKAVLSELARGKTLAAIATEHGKTVQDLESYLLSQFKAQLDKAVANGKLTQDRENTLLENAKTAIDQFVNKAHLGFGIGQHGFGRWWRLGSKPAPNQGNQKNSNPSGSGT